MVVCTAQLLLPATLGTVLGVSGAGICSFKLWVRLWKGVASG